LFEKPLASNDVQYVDVTLFVPIDDSTRRLNDLPISPPLELRQLGTTEGMLGQLAHVFDHTLNERSRRSWLVQGDVVSDRLQVT
jgi:hypothetical protein